MRLIGFNCKGGLTAHGLGVLKGAAVNGDRYSTRDIAAAVGVHQSTVAERQIG